MSAPTSCAATQPVSPRAEDVRELAAPSAECTTVLPKRPRDDVAEDQQSPLVKKEEEEHTPSAHAESLKESPVPLTAGVALAEPCATEADAPAAPEVEAILPEAEQLLAGNVTEAVPEDGEVPPAHATQAPASEAEISFPVPTPEEGPAPSSRASGEEAATPTPSPTPAEWKTVDLIEEDPTDVAPAHDDTAPQA